MRKKSVLSFITFLCAALTFAQEEASFWYFGQNAGLQFDVASGTVTAITDGQLNTLEGCTSISDTSGNLLFYSDGRTIWNANHVPMANASEALGTGLKGDDSSTSSGLIVPKPQDATKYYIFTVDEPHHNNTSAFPDQSDGDGVNEGLQYSLVDINLDGGLGDVDDMEKNVPLITYDETNPDEVEYKCSEKITAVRADDCSSFWVITHFVNKFYAFKVDVDGVDTDPVISTVGPTVPVSGYRRNALGYMKASPDGSKIAVAHFGFAEVPGGNAPGGVYLFDFNNDTGEVTNSIELYGVDQEDSPYGVEFSSENTKLYATINAGRLGNGASSVYQWDLLSADIPASIQTIHTSNTLSAGALQLGLDKRIYRAQLDFSNPGESGSYLGVINNPDALGAAANYQEDGILLDVNNNDQNLSRIGLPPFIQSLFNSQIDIIRNGESTTELKLCTGNSYTLVSDEIPGATYTWMKDDVALSETTHELLVDTPGFYEVFIEPNNGECPIEGEALVGVFDIPTATQPNDLVICDSTTNTIIDLTTQNADILDTQDPNQYTVHYYLTQDDSNNDENEIIGEFSNTESPQIIYAKVKNMDNPNCYADTSFSLSVFIEPFIEDLSDRSVCDLDLTGNYTDGITSITFDEFNSGFLGTQSEAFYTVSYHPTLGDAENNTNAHPNIYTNSTPNTEEVFIRIENDINTDCFVVGAFMLNINSAPEAFDTTLIQCDEDGIPEGFTTFDLNQAFDDITGGATDRAIDFYVSLSDLQNDEDQLDANAFNNYFSPHTIYALVTNTLTGCTNVAQLTLETSATSSSDTALQVCDEDGTEDGLHTFDLSQANDDILFGLPPDLQVTFYETYMEALTEDNPIGTNYTNTVPYNQYVYARVENMNACFGISQVELTVFELPNIVVQEELFYCLNEFPQTITLTGGIIDDTPNNYYYDWSTGEDEFEIEVNQPGTYTVTVTSTDGCSKDRTINVLPSDIATFTDIQVTDATENNSISVFVSGEGVYEFALDDPNGPYQESSVFENVAFGFHTVYVRDIENDCGTVETIVSVIGFPKFFTPNGDTHNPYWKVRGISSEFQPNSQILIFDRYGKLLAEVDPLGPGWDGTFNGVNMPASDYWFVVTLQDGRTFKSHFTLKR